MKATKWILIFFFFTNSIYINKSPAAIQNLNIPKEINTIPNNSYPLKITPRNIKETIVTITGPVPRAIG